MKQLSIFLLLWVLVGGAALRAQSRPDYPIAAVPIQQVTLTDQFWLPRIRTIQRVTVPYGLAKCAQEGRLDNFLIAGGRQPGPVKGKFPFDDTDVYKLIEGAATSLIGAPDPRLTARLDSVIALIKVGQEPDGYLTTWHTIDPNHPPAPWTKGGPRWSYEEKNHELYNSGHLFEAAAAHFAATGRRNFLDIALRNADLLVRTFGSGPGQLKMPPGHQIVETGLIKLYRITGKEAYLALAKFFLDQRGNAATHALYGPYSQDHLPVTEQRTAEGHAVRAMYQYAGMADIAALYAEPRYRRALDSLWENVTTKKMYLTGGIGATREGEAFGKTTQLPMATAYAETCAAIGAVHWNQRMFLLTGEAKYYDVLERTLYNGLLAGISLRGSEFFYPNPLAADGLYRFNRGACTRQAWFDSSCVPHQSGSLPAFAPRLGVRYARQ